MLSGQGGAMGGLGGERRLRFGRGAEERGVRHCGRDGATVQDACLVCSFSLPSSSNDSRSLTSLVCCLLL